MRNTKLALLLVILSAGVAGTLSAATRTETIDKTFDVRPGANVSLTNVNGSVTVKAWDQPRVKVRAIKKVETSAKQLNEIMAELRVEMQPRDGGLVITTQYPKRGKDGVGSFFSWILGDGIDAQVKYELMVPRTMDVAVSNTNGSIRLSDVSGQHELETTNGRIEVDRCEGSLDASTTNGSIRAELTRVVKGQSMELQTTNGRIEVTVPSDFAGNVDAGTVNGAIQSDLPVATTRISRNSLRGTINGGGSALRLRTTNGGIEIRTAGGS